MEAIVAADGPLRSSSMAELDGARRVMFVALAREAAIPGASPIRSANDESSSVLLSSSVRDCEYATPARAATGR